MKNIKFLWVATLLVAGMASCTNNGGETGDEGGTRITITAGNSAVIDANATRTNISTGEGRWDTGEENIGIFIDAAGILKEKLTGTTTDGGLTVKFSGTLSKNLSAGTTYTGYAFYPYGSLVSSGNADHTTGRLELKSEQRPLKNSFDPTANIMYSNSISLSVDTQTKNISNVSAKFNHAVAFIKVVFKDIAAQMNNEPITKFSLTNGVSTQYLAGRFNINLETGGIGFYSSSYETAKIQALYETTAGMVLDGTNAIYLCVAPVDIAAGTILTFYAESNGYIVSKVVTAPAISLQAGKITTLTFTGAVSQKQNGDPLPFNEPFDFVGAASPNNNASVAWDTFPCGSDDAHKNIASKSGAAYKGTNAVRLGKTATPKEGGITTKALDLSDRFTISLDLIPWGSVQTSVKVTIGSIVWYISLSGNGLYTPVRFSRTFDGVDDNVSVIIESLSTAIPSGQTYVDYNDAAYKLGGSDGRFLIDAINITDPSYLIVNPLTQNNVAVGGAAVLSSTISSTAAWTAISSNPDWITIISTPSGSAGDNQTFAYSVAENNTGTARTGTITITASGQPPQTITINQLGAAVTITEKSFTIAAAGGQKGTNITANTSWAVSPNDGWITIDEVASGTGNGLLKFTMAQNTTSAQRTGTLTVTGGNGVAPQTITVVQAAPTLSVTQDEFDGIPPAGATRSTTVTSNTIWTAAVTEGNSWITITSPTGSANGNGTLAFSVAANTSDSRLGAITLSAAGCADIEILIYQLAAGTAVEYAFSAGYNAFGKSGVGNPASSLQSVHNTSNTNVVFGDLTTIGTWNNTNTGANSWGNSLFTATTSASASKTAQFTITSSKTFSISNIKMMIRLTAAGPMRTDVEYKIGAGDTWTAGASYTYTKPSGSTDFPQQTWDLSGISELQEISSGTIVYIRIVPLKDSQTDGSGNWSIKSISANVADDAIVITGVYLD